jgi:hypothetical protein
MLIWDPGKACFNGTPESVIFKLTTSGEPPPLTSNFFHQYSDTDPACLRSVNPSQFPSTGYLYLSLNVCLFGIQVRLALKKRPNLS